MDKSYFTAEIEACSDMMYRVAWSILRNNADVQDALQDAVLKAWEKRDTLVDGMLYPDLVIDDKNPRPIGKWSRMHMKYLKTEYSGLYERLILNETLYRHLADTNKRAIIMLETLIEQMAVKEGITESLKAEQPIEWIGRRNSIRNRAEEVVMAEVVQAL